MIWRIWTLLLVVLVGGVWLLAIPYSPKPTLKTGTVIGLYRDMGMVPEVGATTVSGDVGHDVFEVPDTDAEHLKEAMASGGMDGMDRDGMKGMAKKPADDHAEDGMAKKPMEGMAMKPVDDHAEKGMAKEGMKGMAMETEEDQGKEEEGHGGGGMAQGLSVIAKGTVAEVDAAIAANGIKLAATATIEMKEWRFDSPNVTMKPGTFVRLKVRNTGNIPHEFMIMGAAAMQAVNYRLDRPDWNLLEHEALSEVPFVLPGDGFDMVVQIHRPGMWMYMCMFPYHMQLGMMGALLTPGMEGMTKGMSM